MKRKIVKISVGKCWFCDWEPIKNNAAKFVKVDGAIYVFCPECGLEIPDALFLIGEDVDQ